MDQQKAIKLEIVLQPKKVEQATRNWLDLPPELTANILHKIGVVDILESAQKVCTAWHKICKDPSMWRVVYLDASSYPNRNLALDKICKYAVDRSQGQLVDITIVGFGNNETLLYIANRSSQLKRLTIACCDASMYHSFNESLKKFPLLEELSLHATQIPRKSIETAGRFCPMLKTLQFNQEDCFYKRNYDDCMIDLERITDDVLAVAIVENLPEIRHLELIWNNMSNNGLMLILIGCHHLESLDLRRCLNVDLDGDLVKRHLQRIKCVKLPNDSLKGCPYLYKNDSMTSDDESEEESDDESEEGSDYVSDGRI